MTVIGAPARLDVFAASMIIAKRRRPKFSYNRTERRIERTREEENEEGVTRALWTSFSNELVVLMG